jgi:hypothetical protein
VSRPQRRYTALSLATRSKSSGEHFTVDGTLIDAWAAGRVSSV